MSDISEIKFNTDGGPWVTHNMPCPIYYDCKHAVYNMNTCTFEPSHSAQEDGYMIVRATGVRAIIIRWLSK